MNDNLKILDNKRIQLLKKLDKLCFIKNFIMGGGTSLSLQLGLRDSYDFVFFTNNHFDPNNLLGELQNIFKNDLKVEHIYENYSSLNVLIDGVQVSFFEYKYKTLFPLVKLIGFNNIYLFDIKDITLMKVIAINQRGSKKDFFDFANVISLINLTPQELASLIDQKYGDDNIIVNFIYSLTYFEDAEEDILPKTYVPFNWENIKTTCLNYSKQLTKIVIK